jgi:putative salt-induced outer membrane protein
MNLRRYSAAAAAALLCAPHIAAAELPAPVRAIIYAAIATGDAGKVSTVVELAKVTNSEDIAEVDQIVAGFALEQDMLAASYALKKEDAIRAAGLFDNWSGKGEIGAFRSTGNSSDTGITAGLKLDRIGIDWRHKFRALVDFQRSDGVTTREQFLVAYEPNYALSDRLFIYGLAQYERDRFQGYSARYSLSGGAGYRVIDLDDMHLSVKAGPAYRKTEFLTGISDDNVAALAALDFDFSLSERLKLTQEASAYFQSGNSTYISATGIEAGLGDGLVARLSYTAEHDTNPPIGAVQTDTLSRFTLIYGF